MTFTLNIWRQKGPDEQGRFVIYEARDVSPGRSFLGMLDRINQGLIAAGTAGVRACPPTRRSDH